MNYRIEKIAQNNDICGEGPLWDYKDNRLLWIDAGIAIIYQYFPETNIKSIIGRGLTVGGIALNHDGNIIAAGNGIHMLGEDRSERIIAEEYDNEKLVFNDIIAGPDGCVYAGTFYWEGSIMEKTGSLYLIKTDRSIAVVDDGIKLSNGLAFSPDCSTLYYSDSGERCIYRYDIHKDTGVLSSKSVFKRFSEDEGIPDGITADAEGYVWSALWYGGKVVRIAPDGEKVMEIAFPVKQVSSVMFGGKDLCDLYVTSAGEYWPSKLEPKKFDKNAQMGGALYRIKLDIKGKQEFYSRF